MRIKVVTVDYREGPENKFPAASEDVAKVYRSLLKSYPVDGIGIYGCSAGGMLTAEAIAWFENAKLPRPGAAGVFCAGDGFFGDSSYLAGPLSGQAPIPKASGPLGEVALTGNGRLKQAFMGDARLR